MFICQSNFDLAIDDCTKALEINPLYVKALARRAMCYHKIGNFKEAISDFETCRKLDVSAKRLDGIVVLVTKIEKCKTI